MSIASSPAGELDRDRIRELGERERSTLARRTPRSAEPGPRGTIADVGGVLVGHVTVVRDEADPPAARGVARSGVTAIVPRAPETLRSQPLAAGVAVLNGAGEMTGSLAIGEWGVLQTPVYLTATMSVGRLYDGAVAAAVAADPAEAWTTW